MLERIIIRNFKRFEEVEVELGQRVVLVGPNDSGKTSALQAIGLWELGVRRWVEKRGKKPTPKKRPGVTINRRELVSLPVPDAKQIWRDLRVRNVARAGGKQHTRNIMIDLVVTGVTQGLPWTCGLEFDFANPESIYCRPIPDPSAGRDARMQVPEAAADVRIAYLPPMSGLQSNEARLDPGAVQVRLGEGRTAEVLRNLCWRVYRSEPDGPAKWAELRERIRGLFDAQLEPPVYVRERGELTLSYRASGGALLDISAAGRGMQQTLLLTAYLMANPSSVLLLDEPDAHLEILRQRQVYDLLTSVAGETDCQLIAATHSEVLLNEAAGRDLLVAFVGSPHRIDDRGSQAAKSLKAIGFDHYLQAEQTGWIIYLEGSTDLAILKAFARTIRHPAANALDRPFVHYVGNLPSQAQSHFFGLREAKPDLVGIGLFDGDVHAPEPGGVLEFARWGRREIENYLCFPEVLKTYVRRLAEDRSPGPLFESTRGDAYATEMARCIADRVPPAALRNRDDEWWSKVKASDDFLEPVFAAFFDAVGLPNLTRKTDYHGLAGLVPEHLVDDEVRQVLDRIADVAGRATRRDPSS